ncbi:MAG: FAD-binding protein, partial [Eubacterium sp.]|nr:FAD-binding protein [Eubacterium sp.]
MTQLIELCTQLNIEFKENEPMTKHTTFKIGGPARLLVYPENEEQIGEIVRTAKAACIRLIAIGKGSNLLGDDDGINACVMVLDEHFADIRLIDDETIYASAGAMLIKVCRFAYENGLSGLEFAYGIPGSCGGGAFMNAGAYGGEMKDVLYK